MTAGNRGGGTVEAKDTVYLVVPILVGIAGWLILHFWVNPILAYREIRRQIKADLVNYGNVMERQKPISRRGGPVSKGPIAILVSLVSCGTQGGPIQVINRAYWHVECQ